MVDPTEYQDELRRTGVSLQFSDLLRLPYAPGGRDPATGVDCFWVAQEVCRRVGRVLSSESPQDARCEHLGARWQDATEPGDLVVSAPRADGEPPHVSVLVEPTLVLSCGKSHPTVYAVKAWALPRVVGVWRAPKSDESMIERPANPSALLQVP